MITPIVGMQVWYWPFIGQMDYAVHDQPFAATITHVPGPLGPDDADKVNLLALTETGNPLRMTAVVLAQDRPARTGECSHKEHDDHEQFTATTYQD